MKLAALIAQYIAHKRSLGMKFESPAVNLAAFLREMGNIDVENVSRREVGRFLLTNGIRTPFYDRKHSVLRGLYQFAVARGYVKHSPLPPPTPRLPQILVPYIYSRRELAALFRLAKGPYPRQARVEPYVIHMLLLLLYAAALRISEALALTLSDIDLVDDRIVIRDTKFYKSRCVPIGADLKNALRTYLIRRSADHGSDPQGRCFLLKNGRPVKRAGAEQRFRILCRKADVRRDGGSRVQPRLHDLRHSAAVHRVLAWYRSGKDVQRLLPQLATYLGHVNLSGTQRYLTLTPDLLRQASRRFERHVEEHCRA